jgi:hypothetical protein
MKEICAYILYSVKLDKYYIGACQDEFKKELTITIQAFTVQKHLHQMRAIGFCI